MQELENGEHGCTAEHIQWSIVNAHNGESFLSDGKLGSDILNILGFTSPKVKHLLIIIKPYTTRHFHRKLNTLIFISKSLS